jgi:DnaJ-class molecular chaperone
MINDKDRCQSCKGNKLAQEKKVLEVHVEKGMQHGQKIVFQGEADEAVSSFYTSAKLAHFCICAKHLTLACTYLGESY